jgi:hypothetical protein
LFVETLLISNDGGFFPFSEIPVDSTIPWTLDSSGPERLPKTIYLRFEGGDSGPETYQDDIILDETRPMISSVSVASSKTGISPAKRSARRLTIRATDKTSGVDDMQITAKKSKPGAWEPYKAKTKFKGSGSKIFVRVRDRAGNESKWKAVR